MQRENNYYIELNRTDKVRCFAELYKDFYIILFRYCEKKKSSFREELEDVVHKIFMRLWQADVLDNFRGDSSIKTWLFRIAHNVIIDEVRFDRAIQRSGVVVSIDEKFENGEDKYKISDTHSTDMENVVIAKDMIEEMLSCTEVIATNIRMCENVIMNFYYVVNCLPVRSIAIIFGINGQQVYFRRNTAIDAIFLQGVQDLEARLAYLRYHRIECMCSSENERAVIRLIESFGEEKEKIVTLKHMFRCNDCRLLYAEFRIYLHLADENSEDNVLVSILNSIDGRPIEEVAAIMNLSEEEVKDSIDIIKEKLNSYMDSRLHKSDEIYEGLH